jgi:hypothetical protein
MTLDLILSLLSLVASVVSVVLYFKPNRRSQRLGVAIARELRYVTKREVADAKAAGVKLDTDADQDLKVVDDEVETIEETETTHHGKSTVQ